MQEIKNKRLTPTNDYVFKRIFGKKGNEKITSGFIETVTGVKYEEINLEDTPILERDLLESKMGVLDVKVVANKCNDIDIEMQVVKSEYIADRILWYWSKMYSSSIERGDRYSSTKRAICILIADFDLDNLKGIPEYYTKWNIREKKYKDRILTDKLEIVIIELTKLENMKAKTEEEKRLLNWCKFIKNPENMEESIMKENEELRLAKEELDKINQDARERRLAELREKAIMDEIAIRDSGYNEGYNEGKAKGEEDGFREGKIEGIKEGIKEGIEKGIENGEKKKQIEIVRNMLNEKIDIKTISKVTGLSVEQIENLE